MINRTEHPTEQGAAPAESTARPCELPSSASGRQEVSFRPGEPWLAPLAGWSDLPFRLLCREYGAAVCCTEMVSAKGLIYGGAGTTALLRTCADDRPLVVQLFGSEPPFMAEAVRRLRDAGFEYFDCNMGCAVPKVARTGAGAGLLRRPDNALRVAEAVIREAGEGRAGFKLRLGWNAGDETWRELAPALEARGAAWLSLHPRTAVQGFTGTPRREALAELRHLVRVPVIAGGDLFTAEDGLACLEQTGAHTVMYARGALRDPRIFLRHRRLAGQGGGDVPSLTEVVRRHAFLARKLTDGPAALLKMRTALPRYIRGPAGARTLRQAVVACRNWDDFAALVDRLEEQEHAGEVSCWK